MSEQQISFLTTCVLQISLSKKFFTIIYKLRKQEESSQNSGLEKIEGIYLIQPQLMEGTLQKPADVVSGISL